MDYETEKKIGQTAKWVKNKEILFADALEDVYFKRVKTLKKLKWIVEE